MVLVKGVLRIEAEDHLLDRFGRLWAGQSRAPMPRKEVAPKVEAHLGHPISEMTGAEYDQLEVFLEAAEAAQRDRKPIPRLHPAPKKAPKKR